jgi:hypothetical protein
MLRIVGKIRPLPTKIAFKRELLFSLVVVLCGALLGFVSKAMDGVSIVGDITTEIGVWVFLASILALLCKTPITAAAHTLLFFIAMLAAYYLYSNFVLGFFPRAYFQMWLLLALLTSVGGFLLWFAHGRGLVSNAIAALPIGFLFCHGYPVWYTHEEALLLDIVFAVALVVVLPTTAKGRVVTFLFSVPIAVALSFFLRSGFLPISL